MIAVHFSKEYAQKALDAIQHGKPLPLPPGGRWTGNDLLTLAGILYAAVFSQGPHAHRAAGITPAMLAKMHPERQEATAETFHRDIHVGIEFLSMLTFRVIDESYDDECDPMVQAVVYEEAGGRKTVIPVKGLKGRMSGGE